MAALIRDLLPKLTVGSSVAEHDDALGRYFVETATYRALVQGEKDIVAGDKGTGKTALFRILQDRYASTPELTDVEVVAAFNPVGNPVFQKLADGDPLPEGEYVGIWKSYAFALAGNWILALNDGAYSHKMQALDEMLSSTGLRSADDTPSTVFSQLINLVRRLVRPSGAEVSITFTPEGIPIVIPRLEFTNSEQTQVARIDYDRALRLLNDVLTEVDLSLWLVLDRLDEAFQGFPAAEIPALRALFRTYLDLLAYDHLRLKLFVRKDLFRRIIGDGFVNLTHINAQKIEIIWDDEDLFDLLCRRIAENADLVSELGLSDHSREDLFPAVFPEKVDVAERKPTTWNWILSRIRDGNGIKPPRNLIDLVMKAKDAQLRREVREERVYGGEPLLTGDALKRGLEALSNERVEDTLLAEAGEYAKLIERFRGGKAEHNLESLAEALGTTVAEAKALVVPLSDIGFLEAIGHNYKVPMLYRSGLGITQGRAFQTPAGEQSEPGDPEDEDT
jgi:hypothetical protein